MRVVIDTNVLISGLISPGGSPAKVVDSWIEGVVEVAVSSPIVSEYLGALLRPRFERIGSTVDRQEAIERHIGLPNTMIVVPGVRVSCVSQDQSDDRFLECAKAARSDLIISGDDHLLALGAFDGIPIVNARRFIEMLDAESQVPTDTLKDNTGAG